MTDKDADRGKTFDGIIIRLLEAATDNTLTVREIRKQGGFGRGLFSHIQSMEARKIVRFGALDIEGTNETEVVLAHG